MLLDEELEAQKLVFARSQPCVSDLALTLGSVMIFVKMRRSCKPIDLSWVSCKDDCVFELVSFDFPFLKLVF